VNLPAAANTGGIRSETRGVNTPLTLAADQVMHGCGFVRKRLRGVILKALKHEADSGEFPATAALAMIAAWKNQLLNGELLRVVYGADKFFGDALWNKPLLFDPKAIEEARFQANKRVGTYRGS
jgi:hypothetical protein